jgi:hypothetical protein
LSFHVAVHEDEPDDPDWPLVRVHEGSAGLLVRIGSSTATLRHDTRTVHIELARSLNAVPDALRLLAESMFTAAGVHRRRLHAMHSALVVRDGVGLVLRGPSGAGKSTLTYCCLRAGMGICSDDWLYANASAPAGDFAGYPWRMLMTEDAAARFPELGAVPTVPHPAAEGRKVPVVPPIAQQVVVAHASAVVLLDPAPTLALNRLHPAEAADRFWSAALPTERSNLRPDWVGDLLDRPVYVLHRGSDPVAAAQALAELATSLR